MDCATVAVVVASYWFRCHFWFGLVQGKVMHVVWPLRELGRVARQDLISQ